MNYRETVNLPHTPFSMKADLLKKEPLIRKKWDDMDIYSEIQKARSGRPKYILHDGPPYANEGIHIGTGLNKILKDFVVKFKTMQGYFSPFVPGWDCHGLPIEHRVATSLGDEAKKLSKMEIRKKCQAHAKKFIDVQREQFKGLGVFGDWKRPYLTMDHSYEAAVIDLFSILVERHYVYRKLKPIHWCLHCRTALAEAELEYKNLTSPSIYVCFYFTSEAGRVFGLPTSSRVAMLIWTTTPWTLPANVAVALHKDHDYAAVRLHDKGDSRERIVVLAEALVGRVMKELKVAQYEVIGTLKGKALEGMEYQHPFMPRKGKIILADYVRLEDGTGSVHIAPGHGEEDYMSGLKYDLPIISPVDEEGRFTSEVAEFVGKRVFEADPLIVDKLRREGYLLGSGELVHSYPCCWRCKNPVIFRATEQWFISVDHDDLRNRALDAVARTRWVPRWGQMRIAGMIAGRPDWCISRQRVWGVPVPAFYCVECNEVLMTVETVRKVRDVFVREGADSWFARDAGYFLGGGARCSNCGSEQFRKEDDILDVWFESGASHRAVVMSHPDLSYPADLYLEGTDQHRGWFQLSLLPAIMSEGKAPFKTVLTHGFVVDEKGEKYSKSKGAAITLEGLLAKFGVDILRLWIASVNCQDDIVLSLTNVEAASDVYRKIRNTLRFLLANIGDFSPVEHKMGRKDMHLADKWALSRTQRLIQSVTVHFENFDFHKAFQEIRKFAVVDMSALYFDILKDRLYCEGKNSVSRRSAQTVLYEVLTAFVKMLAPILVHTAEEVWELLPADNGKTVSVHLADWPVVKEEFIDEVVERDWERLLDVREEVTRELERLRTEKLIGNSLEASVTLWTEDDALLELLNRNLPELEMLFIVSGVNVKRGKSSLATKGKKVTGLQVLAERSPYQKCERCWNHRKSVGENSGHPTLCERCVNVMREIAG